MLVEQLFLLSILTSLTIICYIVVRTKSIISQERYQAESYKDEIDRLRSSMASNVDEYMAQIVMKEKQIAEIKESFQQDINFYKEELSRQDATYAQQLKTINSAHKLELEVQAGIIEKAARADALKRSTAVSHGFSSENFAPLLQKEWNHKDFRHMGDPVDFLVFAGMDEVRHGKQTIDEVVLLDIKTGKAQLNKIQRRIRNAVVNGRVVFATYNTDTQELRTWPERPESPQTKFDWDKS